MGKNLKGKEIGKGIRQRKDGRYEARITIKGSGKPPFSIYGTNLQQVRKQRILLMKWDFRKRFKYLEKTRNTEEEKKNGSKVGQRGT